MWLFKYNQYFRKLFYEFKWGMLSFRLKWVEKLTAKCAKVLFCFTVRKHKARLYFVLNQLCEPCVFIKTLQTKKLCALCGKMRSNNYYKKKEQ
jgi:hypothetical protein